MKKGRRHRLPDEVTDLLGGDPELLAVADAIDQTRPRHAPVRTTIAAAILAAAAASAVVLTQLPGTSFVGAARAALGDGEVLHAVLVLQDPDVSTVAADGTTTPVTIRDEFWFDQTTKRLRTRSSRNGQLVVDTVSGSTTAPAAVDPALEGFVDGYTAALKSGAAKTVGSGAINGDSVHWLQFEPGEQVAVSDDTHLPLVLRVVAPGTTTDWQIIDISTGAENAALFKPPPEPPASLVSGDVTQSKPLSLNDVSGSLTFPALSLGTKLDGWTLTRASAQTLTNRDEHGRVSTAQGLQLVYSSDQGEVDVLESSVASPAYAFLGGLTFDFVPIPASGTQVIARVGDRWLAQFRVRDIYVAVRAPDQMSALTFARVFFSIS